MSSLSSSRPLRHIHLELVTEADAELILAFRLDERRNQFLASVGQELSAQQSWLKAYKIREAKGEEFYFKIMLREDSCVGLVRVYDLLPDSFCWGSWLVSPEAPRYVGMESYLAVMGFGFHELNRPRVHFDVMKENVSVLDFHMRRGAVTTGEDTEKMYFQMSREQYESVCKQFERCFAPDAP